MRFLRLAQTITGVLRKRVRRQWRIAQNGAGCAPDFVICGAQKSGTSALFTYLAKSPDVREAATKEVGFFSKFYGKGSSWYYRHFPPPDRPGTITGEATPGYFLHPLAAPRLASALPATKTIFILRNPAERAFSQYRMVHAGGFEPAPDFSKALERRRREVDAAHAQLAHDPDGATRVLDRYDYLAHSRYREHLQRWYRHVPPSQSLVLFREDLLADTPQTVHLLCEFLGVTPPLADTLGSPLLTPPSPDEQRQGIEQVRATLLSETRALREYLSSSGAKILDLGHATWLDE